MEDISKEILNEIERDKIKAFAEDPVAFQAVKKYVLAVVYKHGVFEEGKEFKGNINWALQFAWGAANPQGMPRSDEELGQQIRALTQATQLVESGFKELAEIQEVAELEEDKINEAE